jgi:hypothetical protein
MHASTTTHLSAHRLYLINTVHCDYSSSGRTSSTSTTRCAMITRSWPHRFYINYVVRRDYSSPGCTALPQPCHAPSCRSTSCRSVALALVVRPVTASRGATTCRPDCTGSTAPMSCIWARRLDARLLVSRSHWLSPCARSFRCAS